MSANRDPETVLAAWLDEGPLGLPSETRRAILGALPTTSQARRGPFAPWRLFPMNGYTRLAAVVGLVVLALAGGLFLVGGGQPGPSPSPSPSPVGVDTSTWLDFTSNRHGYSVRYPATLTQQAATRDAALADIAAADPAVWDHFVAGPAATRIIAVSSVVPDDMTIESWTSAWVQTFESGCTPDPATWEPLAVDGYDGFVYSVCNFAEWLGFADGRAYAFTVSEPTGSSATTATRDLLLAVLSTVQIDPSAAPPPAPTTPLPPAMSTPFSSTTFGYEARYPSGWRVARGTTPGSAVDLALGEPVGPARFWDHFEPDQATPGPRLLATSTAIAAGTTEDAWIEAYQEPQIQQAGAACIPARATWQPVTIDGRTGGIYVGCGFVEAITVVNSRVYIFTYLNSSAAQSVIETTGRQMLEAFIATASLQPELVAKPSPASS
ncbi:MAG: hypothetical protein FIA92_06945 [Chloroflexi bacterium]|nr:hypothetical protein [Chloroflexota bacterium]